MKKRGKKSKDGPSSQPQTKLSCKLRQVRPVIGRSGGWGGPHLLPNNQRLRPIPPPESVLIRWLFFSSAGLRREPSSGLDPVPTPPPLPQSSPPGGFHLKRPALGPFLAEREKSLREPWQSSLHCDTVRCMHHPPCSLPTTQKPPSFALTSSNFRKSCCSPFR